MASLSWQEFNNINPLPDMWNRLLPSQGQTEIHYGTQTWISGCNGCVLNPTTAQPQEMVLNVLKWTGLGDSSGHGQGISTRGPGECGRVTGKLGKLVIAEICQTTTGTGRQEPRGQGQNAEAISRRKATQATWVRQVPQYNPHLFKVTYVFMNSIFVVFMNSIYSWLRGQLIPVQKHHFLPLLVHGV